MFDYPIFRGSSHKGIGRARHLTYGEGCRQQKAPPVRAGLP
ncbi:hypothetical protein [Azospirillum palustre]